MGHEGLVDVAARRATRRRKHPVFIDQVGQCQLATVFQGAVDTGHDNLSIFEQHFGRDVRGRGGRQCAEREFDMSLW